MPKQERGLGRGLDALFAGGAAEADKGRVLEVDISLIQARADQPRRSFQEEALQELAASLKEHGLLQPLLVRAKGQGYEIIAGERRWRAARMAGINQIPVLLREIDDIEAAEISLIENLQREDLSVIEEALAYRQMIEHYGYTQELLAQKLGKSRAHVANTMRILNLPDKIWALIEAGQITAGHARALLSLESKELQVAAAQDILERGLSVRAVEEKARDRKNANKAPLKTVEFVELEESRLSNPNKNKKSEILELEAKMQEHFATRVDIKPSHQGGRILIAYYNEEDLERIVELLGLQ